MAKATIDDVAALASVSIKTVSRVVNKEPNVRNTTREKVLAAIQHLNYQPNVSARRLAGNRSYLIGLLYDNPSANYLINIQNGVIETCREAGYDLLVHPCDYTNPKLDAELSTLIAQSRIDGLILTPPLSDLSRVVDQLVALGVPFVRIAPAAANDGSLKVATNDYRAARKMTDYLISLGHTRIGFISGHPDHRSMARRLDGYLDVLKQHQIAISQQLIVQGYNSFESGKECAERLLRQASPPSAIFAGNDDMAAGVVKVAHEMGMRIPADLSVAGFDDTPVAYQIWPSLTTVRQPIKLMAEKATTLLLNNLGKSSTGGEEILLESELVIRDSTGPR